MTAADLPPGGPSGQDTFARYRYQAKLTLFHWFSTITDAGPNAVYAEHVEDILLEYDDRRVFIQVKTKAGSAGTWTADGLCSDGGGIDSLCRAYAIARETNCTFELHLEGTISNSQATVDFVRDCTTANAVMRAKIAQNLENALGRALEGGELDHLLGRCRVVPNQPSQRDVDGRCYRTLARLVPQMPAGAVEALYGRLLQVVEDAQQAQTAGLAEGVGGIAFLEIQLTHLADGGDPVPVVVTDKRLTRDRLLEFIPPDTAQAVLLLIERALDGRPMTALEEKLIAAGAGPTVVEDARSLRAMTEPRRYELLSGPDVDSTLLEDVSNRVLVHARAVAYLAGDVAEPAKAVWAKLVAEPGLENADQPGLFNGDRLSLLGLLCSLSDECRFPWVAQ